MNPVIKTQKTDSHRLIMTVSCPISGEEAQYPRRINKVEPNVAAFVTSGFLRGRVAKTTRMYRLPTPIPSGVNQSAAKIPKARHPMIGIWRFLRWISASKEFEFMIKSLKVKFNLSFSGTLLI
jgi:hypothetical protein